MIKIEELNKYTKFPEHPDYILEKDKKFYKLLPYLTKRIKGDWNIVLVDFPIEALENICKELDIPAYLNLYIYVPRDVYITFIQKHTEFKQEPKKRKDIFMEYILSVPKLIDPNAVSELYKRCNGSVQIVESYMQELLNRASESETITRKIVTLVIPQSDNVYATDIIKSLIACNNTMIPKNGHPLSKYLYKTNRPQILLQKLINTLGNDYAFYALRKVVYKLYKEKTEYLKNKTSKDDYILEVVDIYTLLYMKLAFELSKASQLVGLIYIIECRGVYSNNLLEDIILKQKETDIC